MKVRIRGNSIRLRLMKTEVKVFDEEGKYFEQIDFGKSQLWYGLQKSADHTNLHAELSENEIIINVPILKAENWTSSEDVGFEFNQSLPNGGFLNILVEKDFQCLTERTNEDESDAYENPNTEHK